MTPESLPFADLVGVVVLFAFIGLLARRARRRREAQRRAAAVAAAERFLAAFGIVRVERIAPADIKYGDHITWWSTDGESHEHYTAGFDGDSGPSADGTHARLAKTGRQHG